MSSVCGEYAEPRCSTCMHGTRPVGKGGLVGKNFVVFKPGANYDEKESASCARGGMQTGHGPQERRD